MLLFNLDQSQQQMRAAQRLRIYVQEVFLKDRTKLQFLKCSHDLVLEVANIP